jgi:type I restriction-modification system DNA methylase subunit
VLWEEKIDVLKKQFNPADFKVPFTDWADILKNIEGRFIKKQNSNSHFNNLSDNIKQKNAVEIIAFPNLQNYLTKLDSNHNYWVVVVLGDSQSSQHYVYD